MPELLTNIINLFIFSLIGIFLSFLVMKSSKLLFSFDLGEEIRSGNRAAAIFSVGLMILIGLVIFGLVN